MADDSAVKALGSVIQAAVGTKGDQILARCDDNQRAILESINSMQTQMTTIIEEQNVRIGSLMALVNDLSRTCSDQKRRPKTTAAKATASPENTDADSGSKAATSSAASRFDSNKMVWFKRKCREDVEKNDDGSVKSTPFMEKYILKIAEFDPTIRDKLESDENVTKRKKDDEKIRAKAGILWNIIKVRTSTDPALSTDIETQFKQEKQAFELAQQQPQQSAEQHTPDASDAED